MADIDELDVPAFLRAQEDDEPTPPPPPPTPEQVLEMGRQVAMVRRRKEISRWVRAINRRVLVESLAEQPFSPTLHWLGACVSPGLLERIRSRLAAGADEAALVAAFIELLDSIADDLDEAVSEHARQWAATRTAVDRGDSHGILVREALDDFLFEGVEHPLRAAAAGASA